MDKVTRITTARVCDRLARRSLAPAQQREIAGRKLIPDQELRISGAGKRHFVVG